MAAMLVIKKTQGAFLIICTVLAALAEGVITILATALALL